MTFLQSYRECPQCGDNHKGKPFCTYEDGYHCFSCGYTKSYDRSFSVREQRTIDIPGLTDVKSIMSAFSLENQLWLNKYFITQQEINKYNIKEAPDGALIFCNVENNVVKHYQKRYNTVPRRILSCGKKEPSISSIESDSVAIVEDYISHIRVGRYIDTVCLWGTKCSYDFLKGLLNYKNILVWLDNDNTKEINSGQESAKKICNILNSVLALKIRRYGFGNIDLPKVKLVVTDKDPKAYSPSEIKLILENNHALYKQNVNGSIR